MFNKLNTQKSDPDRIQTYNLLIRSQMLYSVELPGRSMVTHTPRQPVRLSGSDSDRIQTYNLLIRSQMLYSVELPSRQADLPTSLVTAKVQYLDKFSKDSRQSPQG